MSAMNSFEQFSNERNFRFGVVPIFEEITNDNLHFLLEVSTDPVAFVTMKRGLFDSHLGFEFPDKLPLLLEYCVNTPEERAVFINHKIKHGWHIGFRQQSYESVRFLIENCGDPVAFINHKNDCGYHMGFRRHSYESVRFLIENCGDPVAFINHKNDYGIHMGFMDATADTLRLIIENSGTTHEERMAFINHKDNNGGHMGFAKVSSNADPICFLVENSGTPEERMAFVNHKDNNGRHVGFYKATPENIHFLIENSGTTHKERVEFVKHRDKYGERMYYSSLGIKILGLLSEKYE